MTSKLYKLCCGCGTVIRKNVAVCQHCGAYRAESIPTDKAPHAGWSPEGLEKLLKDVTQ